MSDTILYVGWETGPNGLVPPAGSMPEFKDIGGKNPRDAASQEREWLAEFARGPFGGTMTRVMLIDPVGNVAQEFKLDKAVYRPKGFPAKQPVPVAIQVAGWLEKHYAKTLAKDLAAELGKQGKGSLSFVGFEPRRFIKHLGLECSRLGYPPRLGLWYANSDHRDIGSALMPEPFNKQFELDAALQLFQLHGPGFEPGKNARNDAILSLRIALKLGLMVDQLSETGGNVASELLNEEPEPAAEPEPAVKEEASV